MFTSTLARSSIPPASLRKGLWTQGRTTVIVIVSRESSKDAREDNGTEECFLRSDKTTVGPTHVTRASDKRLFCDAVEPENGGAAREQRRYYDPEDFVTLLLVVVSVCV